MPYSSSWHEAVIEIYHAAQCVAHQLTLFDWRRTDVLTSKWEMASHFTLFVQHHCLLRLPYNFAHMSR